jgi:hypothetical protein
MIADNIFNTKTQYYYPIKDEKDKIAYKQIKNKLTKNQNYYNLFNIHKLNTHKN